MRLRRNPHPYSDSSAFQRLMLIIATLLRYPGVGSTESDSLKKEEGSFREVLDHIQTLAQELQIDLPQYSEPTIRKDLRTLRRYGILEQSKYQWGYYLGTGAMTKDELQVAFDAVYSQAKYQQDAQAIQVYEVLEKKLRGLGLRGKAPYPIRTQISRSIVYTNPDEMRSKGEYRETLFDRLSEIETALIKGQLVEIYRSRSLYSSSRKDFLQIYPLQLIYADIAWYLLYEEANTSHLALSRLDRFSNHFKILDITGRGQSRQMSSIKTAHQLLERGWGKYLGDRQEQQLEKAGDLEFVKITVRFANDVADFIQEAEKRHLRQKIKPSKKIQNGKPEYVDYSIELPPRSVEEFCRWVFQFKSSAIFLEPPELVSRHQQIASDILAIYSSAESTQ
jgi:predicted DNA-binding transcriptional regulator YafY